MTPTTMRGLKPLADANKVDEYVTDQETAHLGSFERTSNTMALDKIATPEGAPAIEKQQRKSQHHRRAISKGSIDDHYPLEPNACLCGRFFPHLGVGRKLARTTSL